MCQMHAMEYWSAIKRKAVLTQATTKMNPEDMIQKDKYWMIPL